MITLCNKIIDGTYLQLYFGIILKEHFENMHSKISLLLIFESCVLENRYRNQIYLTIRTEAKNFKYLVLNGDISPENVGMDMMVLKV